jgi:hypothetical protein
VQFLLLSLFWTQDSSVRSYGTGVYACVAHVALYRSRARKEMYSEKVLVGVPGSGSGQYVMEKVLVGVPGSGFSGSVSM